MFKKQFSVEELENRLEMAVKCSKCSRWRRTVVVPAPGY